jgi:hypothetical protein
MAKRYMTNKEEYKIPLVVSVTQGSKVVKVTDDDGNIVDEISKNPIDLKHLEHYQWLDFEDFCNLFTDEERQIVDWMMCRYTHREMGDMKGCSHTQIRRIVDKIKNKLKGEFDFLRKDSDVSINEAGR